MMLGCGRTLLLLGLSATCLLRTAALHGHGHIPVTGHLVQAPTIPSARAIPFFTGAPEAASSLVPINTTASMRDKNGTAIYDCLEPHISKFGDTWFVCVYCVFKRHDLNRHLPLYFSEAIAYSDGSRLGYVSLVSVTIDHLRSRLHVILH